MLMVVSVLREKFAHPDYRMVVREVRTTEEIVVIEQN
jgi:hypothetical protein